MADTHMESNLSTMLTKLKNLRKEHTEASQNTKASLSRVEANLKDVLKCTSKLKQQITEIDQRVSDMEENTPQHMTAIRYLLYKEAKLCVRCKDL